MVTQNKEFSKLVKLKNKAKHCFKEETKTLTDAPPNKIRKYAMKKKKKTPHDNVNREMQMPPAYNL